MSSMFDRVTYPARGRSGGGNGLNGRVRLGSGTELRAKGRQQVPGGDRLIMEMPGGGGFGNPFERDAERVREDVLNELVSREAAERDYGVVLRVDGAVDQQATRRRRKEGQI
jgi:N-methylhydantoinase B